MKNIYLKRIRLSNWKAKNLDVTFNDKATKISAKNEVGKSSLQQAFNWVFTSMTTPTANKNADLFDNRVELSPDTPEASVKLWLDIDGYEYTIERAATAKFTRPRNSVEWVKSPSDTYTTKIDDIEYSATDFNDWVETNICPLPDIQYVLDGAFFSTLSVDDKHKARKVLEGMVGEIKFEDFSGDYTLIEKDLGRYTAEQIKEQAANRIKPVKKRLDEIPAIIEDKEKTIEEWSGIDFVGILAEIEKNKKRIEEIDGLILGKNESIQHIIDERNNLLRQISELEDKTRNAKREFEYEEDRKIDIARETYIAKQKDLAEIVRVNALKEQNKDWTISALNTTKTRLAIQQKTINELRTRRDEVKAQTFVDTTCPTCGAPLSDEAIAEAKMQFEENKAKELAHITKLGKACSEDIKTLEDTIKKYEESLDNDFIPEELFDITPYKEAWNKAEREKLYFIESDVYTELSAKIAQLKSILPEIPSVGVQDLTNEKKTLMDELEKLNREYGIKDRITQIEAEIKALQDERRGVACELAHLEGIQDKCKEYIEERANIISNRINDRLTGAKIVMFSIQKNGERVPDCILTDDNGVRYSTLSNSARLRVNIAIQELFRAHYGIDTITWVDEASVYDNEHLPKPNSQVCYMYAGETNYLVVE